MLSSGQIPVKKMVGKPVLVVEDFASGSRVHLVGVSHGSSASASLVKKVVEDTNPEVVVLELCEDRFIAISLDAKIRPNDKHNSTWSNMYDEKLVMLEKMQDKANFASARFGQKGIVIMDGVSQFYGAFNFARGQGLVAGIFVGLGLFVSSVQKLVRAQKVDDEFIAAMRLASDRKIPVRLGDASQNDTLNSIKGIVSKDTFDVKQIWEGAQLLVFSAFGMFPQSTSTSFKPVLERIPSQTLLESKFLNIPKAYAEDKAMLSSLVPFIVLLVATFFIDFSPDLTTASSLSSSVLGMQLSGSETQLQYTEDLVTSGVDIFALLLLIRMTKLIGTDRDIILAQNIRKVIKECPPNSDIVVVIGMLHANGISRLLLSGLDDFQTLVSSAPDPSSSPSSSF